MLRIKSTRSRELNTIPPFFVISPDESIGSRRAASPTFPIYISIASRAYVEEIVRSLDVDSSANYDDGA